MPMYSRPKIFSYHEHHKGGYLILIIGNEWKGKFVFYFKFLLCLFIIRTYTQHFKTIFL